MAASARIAHIYLRPDQPGPPLGAARPARTAARSAASNPPIPGIVTSSNTPANASGVSENDSTALRPSSHAATSYPADWSAEGSDYAYLGYSLAQGGDINGDGFPDAALGSYAGDVHLLLGGDRADAAITSSITGFSDPSVGLGGDMNGDGQDDLVVTEVGASVNVFYDPTRQATASDADVVLTNPRLLNVQWSATIPGDTNDDGYDDLLEIDCFKNPPSGHPVAHLFLGPAASATDFSGAEATITLGTNYQSCAAAGAGDLDGDGKPDIVLGNVAEDRYAGAAYVLLSPISGALTTSDADGLLRGAAASDFAGTTVGPLGDINADGADDMYVGAIGVGDYGSLYLIFGGE